jgi:hypothetical protein
VEGKILEAQLTDSGSGSSNKSDKYTPHDNSCSEKKEYSEVAIKNVTKGRISFSHCKIKGT